MNIYCGLVYFTSYNGYVKEKPAPSKLQTNLILFLDKVAGLFDC